MVDFIRDNRILLYVFGVFLIVGTREIWLSRQGPVNLYNSPDEKPSFAEALDEVNPGTPDAKFMMTMRELQQKGNAADVKDELKAIIDSGVKHNVALFHSYVQFLIENEAPLEEVTAAIEQWRTNFPASPLPLRIPVAKITTNGFLPNVAREAVADVPWVKELRINLEGPPVMTIRIHRNTPVDLPAALDKLRQAGVHDPWDKE